MNHSDDLGHLAECSSCRQRFSENVVPFDAARRREGARKFAATAAQMERERSGVAGAVERLLRDTPIIEWPALAESQALRNNAALEQLSEAVRKRTDRDNIAALAIANLATSIAESLPSNSYPAVVLAQIRATAWRDRANALRYLARHDEALESIDRAESNLDRFAAAAHDRAVIGLVKAMILAQTERFDEAQSLIDACRAVFLESGDSKRYLDAGIVQANALYRASRFEKALALYADLLRHAAEWRDLESQARLHNNLGYCLTQLADYAAAKIHFSNAVAGFTDLGYKAEIPRTERGAGLILIARGQTASGLEQLRDARRDFTAFGMAEEAGLCALSIAETLLHRGQNAEASTLIDTVAEEFQAGGIDERVIGAVVRLRDAMRVNDATADSVHTVHAYLESLRSAREKAVTA
jgi:tetratricopeptide (TPR) repeat protein